MVHRDHLTASKIITWDDGAFITYNDFSVNRQILLWLNADGSIQREDTLELPLVQFAYLHGSNVCLVTENYNNWLMTNTIAVYSYSPDGSPADIDTALTQQLETNQFTVPTSLDYRDGVLSILAGTVRDDDLPDRYRLQLAQFTGSEGQVFDEWNPGPIAADVHLFPFAIQREPLGSTLVGYGVVGDQQRAIRIHAVSGSGVPEAMHHVVDLPPEANLNGLLLLSANDGVYAAYTINDPMQQTAVGAYVTAFPLAEILVVNRRTPQLPISLALTAYPNPFNSSVSIDFSIPRVGDFELSVYNVAGREVARFHPESNTSASGGWNWTPDGAATGMYFVELRYGLMRKSERIIYLK